MFEGPQEAIREILRVPSAPEPPRGDPRSVRVFRAARGFYRYRLLGWGWAQATGVFGIAIGLVLLRSINLESMLPLEMFLPSFVPTFVRSNWSMAIEAIFITFFLANAALSWLLLTLDYRCRWYMITDRSLRIRDGLWKVRERTMTFSNVQNISVRQGPLQRLFGIADLRVQSAGGGAGSGPGAQAQTDHLHIGTFRGVDNAEEIRQLIVDYLRRDPASGEPELAAEPEIEVLEDSASSMLAAAREVLDETRSLAAVLGR